MVFTLRSHTFLKCQSFFFDEPSFLPLDHLAAKCFFISDFFFFVDYFLLQFLLTFISLSGVSLSDLIFNHFSWTSWNQRSGFVNSLLLLEFNYCHTCSPKVLFVPMYLWTFHTEDWIFASKMALIVLCKNIHAQIFTQTLIFILFYFDDLSCHHTV